MHVRVLEKQTVVMLWLLLALAGHGHAAGPQTGPNTVVYSVVGAERLTITSELPGRVLAPVAAEVRPQVDGIIQERLFAEGSDVVKGQVLYQIDPSVYHAAYNTAKAALEEAEAKTLALKLLEGRYRHLVKSNAISQQELDNAVANHGQARAQVARAKAELETASINLAHTTIKAPVSGRIGRSSVTPGALVTANQPGALAVIQQTGRVYVDITQSSAELLRLRRSMAQGKFSSSAGTAKVRLLLEDGTPYTLASENPSPDHPAWITGDLLFSEISVGQATGIVTIRAVFDNPDGLLLPGMYVKALLEEGVLENAVLIPQGSVFSNGSGGHYVLVLEKEEPSDAQAEGGAGDGAMFRVIRRDIALDRSRGNRWIVKSGLRPADILVVEGMQKATPGDSVKAVPAERTAASPPVRQPGQEAR